MGSSISKTTYKNVIILPNIVYRLYTSNEKMCPIFNIVEYIDESISVLDSKNEETILVIYKKIEEDEKYKSETSTFDPDLIPYDILPGYYVKMITGSMAIIKYLGRLHFLYPNKNIEHSAHVDYWLDEISSFRKICTLKEEGVVTQENYIFEFRIFFEKVYKDLENSEHLFLSNFMAPTVSDFYLYTILKNVLHDKEFLNLNEKVIEVLKDFYQNMESEKVTS